MISKQQRMRMAFIGASTLIFVGFLIYNLMNKRWGIINIALPIIFIILNGFNLYQEIKRIKK
ncbi:hypothetical protein [uncultured Clostridium sp.]|jgi:hypothetical protein|uniref:hypothetical protein n=1 Tax=uncultured Clostridium sp. TaxID=59620 RepID=UPI0026369A44|nr:hypothetical protein [uncultured Clostridium sp.]